MPRERLINLLAFGDEGSGWYTLARDQILASRG